MKAFAIGLALICLPAIADARLVNHRCRLSNLYGMDQSKKERDRHRKL